MKKTEAPCVQCAALAANRVVAKRPRPSLRLTDVSVWLGCEGGKEREREKDLFNYLIALKSPAMAHAQLALQRRRRSAMD